MPGLMGDIQRQVFSRPKPGIAVKARAFNAPMPAAPAMPVKPRIGKPSYQRFKGPVLY